MQSYETFNLNEVNLNIFQIKYAVLDKSWKNDNVCSSFTRIYLPVKGEGIVRIGDETIRLVPDNIYIIPASLKFAYKCEDHLEKLYIHLSFAKQDGYDALSGIGKCLILKEKGKIIEKIFRLLNEHTIESSVEFKASLCTIILDGLSENGINLGKSANYPELVVKTLSYIDKHLDANLTVEEIASALFTSRSTLHNTFKENMHMTLGKYIDDRIMAECEKYLINSNLNIKEISERLGFCDQFYFSRKFSKRYGSTPSIYRKMNSV